MDNYELLGVGKDATPEEIKKAYQRAAKENHPDREGGDGKKMASINKAYDTLSDPEKRKAYDAGEELPPQEPPLEVRAELLLRETMNGLIGSMLEIQNPVALLRDKLAEGLRNNKFAIKTVQNKITQLETAISRVRYKGQAQNFMEDAMKSAIGFCKDNIASSEKNIALLEAAMKLLEDYDWEEPPPPTAAYPSALQWNPNTRTLWRP